MLWAGGIEAVLLWLAAACGLGGDVQSSQVAMLAMIALTAAAMGFRNATVRQLKIADLTTTVLTLTITGLAADSATANSDGVPNVARRIAGVLAILVGALIGAVLVLRAGLALPLAIAGLITLGATVALARDLPPEA